MMRWTLSSRDYRKQVNWVLDADIKGFLDAMAHAWIVVSLEHRIRDSRVLHLHDEMTSKVGAVEDGRERMAYVACARRGHVTDPRDRLSVLCRSCSVRRASPTSRRHDCHSLPDEHRSGFQHEHVADRRPLTISRSECASWNWRCTRTNPADPLRPPARSQREKPGRGGLKIRSTSVDPLTSARDNEWGSFVIGRKTIEKRMRAKLLAIKIERWQENARPHARKPAAG